MGDRYYRHPIAKRPPVGPPPRIETRVRRGAPDTARDDFAQYDDDGVVCTCYPRPSQHTVPSMFYDKITCPHRDQHAHIQPAHSNQFNYPWTAHSIQRPRNDDDELSERLSLITEEDDQLRFSPYPFKSRNPDDISVRTAPPLWQPQDFEDRDRQPPHTAPVNDTQVLMNGRRAQSMQDIRDPAYRSDGLPPARDTAGRSRLSNRQFTGTYVDPREYQEQ